ncbi:MAG: sulfatase-like hydrolase/transferase, partial [Rickettsiales bacterium]|nr:sulfatase-like hydrolase/transferase [Rickettsiales bacterium]
DIVGQTLVLSFGQAAVLANALGFGLAWCACFAVALRIKPANLRFNSPFFALAAAVLWLAVDAAALGWAVLPFVTLGQRSTVFADENALVVKGRGRVGAVVREFGDFHAAQDAPVFIVQLESANALALSGAATPGTGLTAEQLMPVMYGAHEEGVLVPYIWGASMQTHRGQGAILCASALDSDRGISMLTALPDNCLPALLKRDGYITEFFSAFASGSFSNTRNFMRGIGFGNAHFLHPVASGGVNRSWGVDDCDFYDRNFDYLEKEYGAKMQGRFMAMFSVVANHFPFTDGLPAYRDFLPFAREDSLVKAYLNSAAAQDHCLERFFERVEPYRERAHIVIVADHSWPVKLDGSAFNERGASSDHFLIPFLYLPPRQAQAQYRTQTVIADRALGQVDILPTLLELLSGKAYSHSFAPLLRRGEASMPAGFDDCYVMTQPYDGLQIAVVRGRDKYTYHAGKKLLTQTRLRPDFIEEATDIPPQAMSLSAFLEGYLCQDYRFWEEQAEGVKAVPLFVRPGWRAVY